MVPAVREVVVPAVKEVVVPAVKKVVVPAIRKVVVPAVREVVVPSHRVNLGHVNIQGIGQTVNEGSTFSKSISHSRASDVKHKHVHNDIVHLSAHHHDHTNVHKVRYSTIHPFRDFKISVYPILTQF